MDRFHSRGGTSARVEPQPRRALARGLFDDILKRMVRGKRWSRGVSLGITLIALSALASIIFLAISAGTGYLHLSQAEQRREHAKNLAEAAIAEALDKMAASDFKFGSQATDRVEVSFSGLEDAEGIVSFVPGELPNGKSTYNFEGDASIPGERERSVPPRAAHLLARGRVGTTQAWVECVFHRPPFPDALISSGPVEASGLTLASVRTPESYQGGEPRNIDPEELLAGNLFSNASHGPDNGPSVNLGPHSRIMGSLGSVGAILVDPLSVVEGSVRPGASVRTLPEIDIPSRIAVMRKNSVTIGPVHSGPLVETWFSHAPNGLTVPGDLDLNGSSLSVNGQLRVEGRLKGAGIVLVNGPVAILNGGSNVVSTDEVAVAATGNVELRASGESNYFKGLVYSEGDVVARDITVVGALMTHGKNGAEGSMKLENVRFIHTPSSVTLALKAPNAISFENHYLALSVTLRMASNGEDYIADVRAYACDANNIHDDGLMDRPFVWKDQLRNVWPVGYIDKFEHKVWKNQNVGDLRNPPPPAPGSYLAEALGGEIGDWMDQFEIWRGPDQTNWKLETQKYLDTILRGMMVDNGTYDISLNLNNLFSDKVGQSRILLWRTL